MSNSYPLVSIIMNCYNGEKYLSESVKSILNQTYKNFEVIFWDNQSKDRSAYIYKNFRDKRLKYFYAKKHTSLYEARNLAIKKSKGKYIAFLDTDDLWDQNKLFLQMQKFEKKKVKLVYSNYYILSQFLGIKKLFYKQRLPEGIIYKELLKNYLIGICTVIVKKYLLKKKLFNRKFNIIGDFDLFTKLSVNNYFACVQEPLSIYRVHKNSFSNKNYEMHVNELKYWLSNQSNFKKKSFFFFKQKIIYMEAILNLLNKNYILSIEQIFKIYSIKKKIKFFLILLIPNYILKILKNNLK